MGGRSPNSTNVAALTIMAAALSLISCSLIALSIRADQRSSKSYHLILVQSLMRADIGLALCVVVYSAVQFNVHGRELEAFCNAYLPFVVYFFLVSASWTIMLALRFRSSQDVSLSANKPPLPVWAVWAIPVVFAAAVAVCAWTQLDITNVRLDSGSTNHSCTFNHSSRGGIATDLICYQAPLLAILFINIYTYSKGLLALKNAPHSVVARQMKKAGGYLFVLIFVWVPVIVYNFIVIFDKSSAQFSYFWDLTVILQALQGFLNCCVYVYSNRTMMAWLTRNAVFLAVFRAESTDSRRTISRRSSANPENSDRPSPSPLHISIGDAETGAGAGVEMGAGGGAGTGVGAGGAEVDYESDDDTMWLASADSFSDPRNKLGERGQGRVQGVQGVQEQGRHSDTVNVLMQASAHTSTGSVRSQYSTQSTYSTKSILIRDSSSKAIETKGKGARFYPEMDKEKFVRFGDNETRMMSISNSSVRESAMSDMSEMEEACRESNATL